MGILERGEVLEDGGKRGIMQEGGDQGSSKGVRLLGCYSEGNLREGRCWREGGKRGRDPSFSSTCFTIPPLLF